MHERKFWGHKRKRASCGGEKVRIFIHGWKQERGDAAVHDNIQKRRIRKVSTLIEGEEGHCLLGGGGGSRVGGKEVT